MKEHTSRFLVVPLVMLFAAAACAKTPTTSSSTSTAPPVAEKQAAGDSSTTTMQQSYKLAASPVATVITNFGSFTVKFYAADAPELTKNFLELARAKYYDGLTFHRIIPDFVIQGGDPNGDGSGGRSYKGEGVGLADEAGALGLKHERGSVAWAKSSSPNSIGSQFYVALGPLPSLDGKYSVFGQVTDGLDVVDKIAEVETGAQDRPATPVTIQSMVIAE